MLYRQKVRLSSILNRATIFIVYDKKNYSL
nr:MAG TPA: hypothetical protein [Caudoviricetes sp.]